MQPGLWSAAPRMKRTPHRLSSVRTTRRCEREELTTLFVDWMHGDRPVVFVELVFGLLHAQRLVGFHGARVVAVDVEAKPAHVGVLAGQSFNVTIDGAEHAVTAELGLDEHTLEPPDHTVAPVGELVGEHGRADDTSAGFGDKVAAHPGAGKTAAYARADDGGRVIGTTMLT